MRWTFSIHTRGVFRVNIYVRRPLFTIYDHFHSRRPILLQFQIHTKWALLSYQCNILILGKAIYNVWMLFFAKCHSGDIFGVLF